MTYQEAIKEAEEMGMLDGTIVLIIVNGLFERAEYQIRRRKKKVSIDSIQKSAGLSPE